MERLVSAFVYLLPAGIALFMLADVHHRTRSRSGTRSGAVLMLCYFLLLTGSYIGTLSVGGAFDVVHAFSMLFLWCAAIGLTYRLLALELHPKHIDTRYGRLLQTVFFGPLLLLFLLLGAGAILQARSQHDFDYAYILSYPLRFSELWFGIGVGTGVLTVSLLLFKLFVPSSPKERRIVAALLIGAVGGGAVAFAAVRLERAFPGWELQTLGLFFWAAALYYVIRKYDYIPSVETRYEILFHASPIGIVLLDRESIIRELNTPAADILGWNERQLVGKRLANLMSNESRAAFLSRLGGARPGTDFPPIECDTLGRSGERKHVAFSGRYLYVEDENLCLLTMNDMTPLRNAEASVNRLATYDELTGLHNRSFAVRQIERMLSEPIALFVLDLDRFKFINDTLGHQAGNEIIRRTALQLQRLAGDSLFVARLGGDSFLVAKAMPRGEKREADALAAGIVKAIAMPIPWQGAEMYVTTSVGVAMSTSARGGGDALLKHAELAMYQAKELGGNQYAWHAEDKSEELAARLQLANALRRALARNEFELAYQPQFDTDSGRMVGAEALLRWTSSELGVVSPQTFIPIAEHIGLIEAIGEWVLREACGQVKRWREQGYDPTVISVNISGRQMENADFVGIVRSALDEEEVPPSLIRLEITESAAIRDMESCREKVAELARMGLSFSLDDFGTGYSSLSLLTELPFRSVKIDKSFIARHAGQHARAAIVEAIVAMAKRLRLNVVAEGVETEEQLSWLRAIGCDFVQGYFTGKPMGAKEFERRLLQRPGFAPMPAVNQTNLSS